MVKSSNVHKWCKWPSVFLYVIHFDDFVIRNRNAVRAASTWRKDSFVSIVCYLRHMWSQVLIWKLSHSNRFKPFHFRVDNELLDLNTFIFSSFLKFIILSNTIHYVCNPSILIFCRSFSLDRVSFIFCWFVNIDYIFLNFVFTPEK